MNRRKFLKLCVAGAAAVALPVKMFVKDVSKLSRDFWVGTGGKDTNPGTRKRPLATIAAAIKQIDRRAKHGNTIFVLPKRQGKER